jgi:CBS domain-containing protein
VEGAVEDAVEDEMVARDDCLREPVTVDPDATVLWAIQRIESENVGCIVVTEKGRPVGLLTDRDVALGVLMRRLDASAVPVREVMTRPVQTIEADAPLEWALSLLRTSRQRQLPVVDSGGALVGLLALDDVMRRIATEVGDLAGALRRQLPPPPPGGPVRRVRA